MSSNRPREHSTIRESSSSLKRRSHQHASATKDGEETPNLEEEIHDVMEGQGPGTVEQQHVRNFQDIHHTGIAVGDEIQPILEPSFQGMDPQLHENILDAIFEPSFGHSSDSQLDESEESIEKKSAKETHLNRQGSSASESQQNWDARYKELLEFLNAHGHINTPKNASRLSTWVARQRAQFRIQNLPRERIERLEEVNFQWENTNSRWDARFQELKQWVDTSGHCCVPTLCGELGRWVAKQRQLYKKKSLSSYRIDKLNTLGFIWDPGEMDWDEKYRTLVEWARHHKNSTRVPFNQGELGWWVNGQRQAYRKRKLNQRRIDLLNRIGFEWVIHRIKKEDAQGSPGLDIDFIDLLPKDDQPIIPTGIHQHDNILPSTESHHHNPEHGRAMGPVGLVAPVGHVNRDISDARAFHDPSVIHSATQDESYPYDTAPTPYSNRKLEPAASKVSNPSHSLDPNHDPNRLSTRPTPEEQICTCYMRFVMRKVPPPPIPSLRPPLPLQNAQFHPAASDVSKPSHALDPNHLSTRPAPEEQICTCHMRFVMRKVSPLPIPPLRPPLPSYVGPQVRHSVSASDVINNPNSNPSPNRSSRSINPS